jgi:hypothetical protein
MKLPVRANAGAQAEYLSRNIVCVPMPKGQEAFAFEKLDERLMHPVINTIAGFNRAVGVGHMSTARIILVVKPRRLHWPGESIYKSEFGESVRGEQRGILEELFDILQATDDIELVVENLHPHWEYALKESPESCQ